MRKPEVLIRIYPSYNIKLHILSKLYGESLSTISMMAIEQLVKTASSDYPKEISDEKFAEFQQEIKNVNEQVNRKEIK